MHNKPTHTFTWLKVFVCFFLAIYIILSLLLGVFSVPLMIATFVTALLGLLLGFAFNLLNKYRRPLPLYVVGHITAVFLLALLTYQQINSYLNVTDSNISETLPAAPNTTLSPIIRGDEKHAMEEVIFLMEQQYPFGAYDIIDIVTEPANNDSSAVNCTIVFTLKENPDVQYISQYLVKDGPPQPVYIKKDTTSQAFRQYRSKKNNR